MEKGAVKVTAKKRKSQSEKVEDLFKEYSNHPRIEITGSKFIGVNFNKKTVEAVFMMASALEENAVSLGENAKAIGELAKVFSQSNINIESLLQVGK